MSELSNEFRVQFSKKGMQENWILEIRALLPIAEIARLCRCSERTIRDWQREKFFMDYVSLHAVCKHLRIDLPSVQKIPRYAHTSRAGKKGGKEIIRRYGKVAPNEVVRKQKWELWWQKEGKYAKSIIREAKPIFTPRKSEKLAEFVGIMLGDGSIASYHVAVTLNATDDAEYAEFVTECMQTLFKVVPHVYYRKDCNALNIVITRKLLVTYLQSLGLKQGSKVRQQVSIPEWILVDPLYARACVRGLMDTDGSVFKHTYMVKTRSYTYTKLSFTSASVPLREGVQQILQQNGMTVVTSGRNVRIEAKDSVQRYLQCIGTHNPKHLKRSRK